MQPTKKYNNQSEWSKNLLFLLKNVLLEYS